MRKINWILSLLLILSFGEISAQGKKWTLEDCINYAVINNIGLQRQRLQTEVSEANLLKSKMDVLPNLNFGSDARVGFGRSIDPVTNLITFKQNLSNSYSLNSNIELFNGFATLNIIAANKFMLKAGLETEKVTKNTLIVDIMGQYYQVLYTKGLENASKMQLDLSEKQLFRIVKMVETGKEALSRQYEIESQVSADKLAYTIALNTASQALTTLKQMLQLEPGSDFDILLPDLNNVLIIDGTFNSDSIYNIAAQTLPRLKAIEYELKASKKQVSAAKGFLAPRLSVGGAVFTGYYKVISEGAADQESFSNQLKNNNSQAVFLSLNVPIFNNYTTGKNIKLAKIRKNDNELRLELERNNLYTEIENACLNFNRGKDEFAAAEANFEYNKKSFNAVEKKFESGLVDVTDYSAAKTTLFSADTEALRTKLQLLIRKLTIQFYSTGEYENLITN
ncbi:MAG TPA: TolC family protein [Bacteroidales bacterium]|nr:TolC family protein [Bacteroidales bacterium]